MPLILEFFRELDVRFYYLLCQAHGSWFFDRFAIFQESNTLLKSGAFIGTYWYFWFRKGTDRQQRRQSILTIIAATVMGLAVTRLVATVLPFRVRPLYDPNLLRYPLSFVSPMNFVEWSAFPSDHAAYLGALGFGLCCLSRRLAIPVAVFLVGWIWFPRLYLGIHYASDVIAGTAIGAATVWAALRIGLNRSQTAQSVLEFVDTRPEWFYPAAYLFLFEMSVLFWDIRSPIRAVLHAASTFVHGTEILGGIVLLGSLCAIAIAFCLIAKKYFTQISGRLSKWLSHLFSVPHSGPELPRGGARR